MRSALVWCLAWPALALAQPSLNPSTVAAEVPTYIARELGTARLAGHGTLKWFGLNVYDARLYVPERSFDAGHFASHSFALEITYVRHLSGKAIAERSRDEIEKLGIGTEEERAAWLREMKKLFPTLHRGRH